MGEEGKNKVREILFMKKENFFINEKKSRMSGGRKMEILILPLFYRGITHLGNNQELTNMPKEKKRKN